jgi:hypothetical protein
LAIVIGIGLLFQTKANVTLRNEQARLRERVFDLERLKNLQAQNKTVAASSVDSEKLQAASDEVVRLRSSIEKLKSQRSQAATQAKVFLPIQKQPNESWRNVGQATPTDTLHSVIWAAVNGEVDALMPMLAFDSESRKAAESLLASLPDAIKAQYPTIEKLVATMMSGRMATDLVQADVVEQTNETLDLTNARFKLKQASGAQKKVTFKLQRVGSEWQLLVPASVVASFQESLKRA